MKFISEYNSFYRSELIKILTKINTQSKWRIIFGHDTYSKVE